MDYKPTDYELALAAHELAGELGGVPDEQLEHIKTALIEAYNAGVAGDRMI